MSIKIFLRSCYKFTSDSFFVSTSNGVYKFTLHCQVVSTAETHEQTRQNKIIVVKDARKKKKLNCTAFVKI